MADEIDLANDLIASEVSRALSKLRQNAAQEVAGTKYCIECGERIPEGRKKLGFKLCVPLQRRLNENAPYLQIKRALT